MCSEYGVLQSREILKFQIGMFRFHTNSDLYPWNHIKIYGYPISCKQIVIKMLHNNSTKPYPHVFLCIFIGVENGASTYKSDRISNVSLFYSYILDWLSSNNEIISSNVNKWYMSNIYFTVDILSLFHLMKGTWHIIEWMLRKFNTRLIIIIYLHTIAVSTVKAIDKQVTVVKQVNCIYKPLM